MDTKNLVDSILNGELSDSTDTVVQELDSQASSFVTSYKQAAMADVMGGTVGLVIDGRGRPLVIPDNESDRIAALKEWGRELKVYPEEILKD